MGRFSLMFALAVAIVTPAAAKSNPPKMTCEEFASLSEEIRPRAVAWMEGYSKGKLAEKAVGEIDVDRQTATLVEVCVETPKESFWDKVKSHLPRGKKKVKPVDMNCEEFISLDETVRPEVVYWLHGYDAATKTNEDVVGEVDLERDVNVLVIDCKEAPRESLWGKIKNKF